MGETFVGDFHQYPEDQRDSPSCGVGRLPVVLLVLGQLLVFGLVLSEKALAEATLEEQGFVKQKDAEEEVKDEVNELYENMNKN